MPQYLSKAVNESTVVALFSVRTNVALNEPLQVVGPTAPRLSGRRQSPPLALKQVVNRQGSSSAVSGSFPPPRRGLAPMTRVIPHSCFTSLLVGLCFWRMSSPHLAKPWCIVKWQTGGLGSSLRLHQPAKALIPACKHLEEPFCSTRFGSSAFLSKLL